DYPVPAPSVPPPSSPPPTPPPDSPPPRSEKEELLRALKDAQWKKKKAAKLMGVSRSTFYRKLDKFGIRGDED
ncbi:MAG: helix-turn-helix domain-containing protein, partial [Magnetococcales bacterium]|nr:helix-turn-helix domain-containing protein [Magnetococcales bacterium]